eukprot:6395129-Amphidinium_carterae.1
MTVLYNSGSYAEACQPARTLCKQSVQAIVSLVPKPQEREIRKRCGLEVDAAISITFPEGRVKQST